MDHRYLLWIGICLAAFLLAPDLRAQVDNERSKRAQTTMKFLQGPRDPRAAALGGAMTALEGTSSSLFFNPAGMARLPHTADLTLAQSQWIAEIDYNMATAAFAPFGGRFGVVGLSFVFVDYGELQGTIRFDNDDGFLETVGGVVRPGEPVMEIASIAGWLIRRWPTVGPRCSIPRRTTGTVRPTSP